MPTKYYQIRAEHIQAVIHVIMACKTWRVVDIEQMVFKLDAQNVWLKIIQHPLYGIVFGLSTEYFAKTGGDRHVELKAYGGANQSEPFVFQPNEYEFVEYILNAAGAFRNVWVIGDYAFETSSTADGSYQVKKLPLSDMPTREVPFPAESIPKPEPPQTKPKPRTFTNMLTNPFSMFSKSNGGGLRPKPRHALINAKTLSKANLMSIAAELNIHGRSSMTKTELLKSIRQHNNEF